MEQNFSIFPPKFVPVPPDERSPEPGLANWIPLMIIPLKQKVRIVFEAAARMGGNCLNDCFLQSPDNNNALRTVLMRFRMRPVAFTADIQNMLNQFFVPKRHRTYLRFFWFKDNDLAQPLVEYYSCVHLQGLTGSPAVADVCRRFASKKIPPDLKDLRQELGDLSTHLLVDRLAFDRVDEVLSNQFYIDDLVAKPLGP